MRVTRRRQAKTFLQPHLSRCRIEQIDAAYDCSDALLRIIHNHCKLIGILAVSAQQHKIADFALQILARCTLNAINKRKFAIRYAQPPSASRPLPGQARPTNSGVKQATVD